MPRQCFPAPDPPPSLPILLIPPSRVFVRRIKPQTLARSKRPHRNHAPQNQRHNLKRQNINPALRISRRTTPRRNREPPLPHIPSRLNLHPPQPPPRSHNQVICPLNLPHAK